MDFPPEYRNYLIYGDESGIHGSSLYYGWGTLWIPAERRGDLSALLQDLKRTHRFHGEVKWVKLKGRNEPFALDLITEFFKRNWIMFHCLVVKRSEVRVDLFAGGLAEARLHHLTTMLRKKIEFFGGSSSDKAYHVRVDPLPSAYAKEDEKLWKITNAMLVETVGDPKIKTLSTVADSRTSAGVQIADVLLGAVLCPWNQAVVDGTSKPRIAAHLLDCLGWSDHLADTFPAEWKFNIWTLRDRFSAEPRRVKGRACRHRYPVKAYRQPRC